MLHHFFCLTLNIFFFIQRRIKRDPLSLFKKIQTFIGLENFENQITKFIKKCVLKFPIRLKEIFILEMTVNAKNNF